MKVKDVITALQKLNPEADLKIVVKQSNKVYGLALDIEESKADPFYWINGRYGASITVHLPEKAFISRLPESLKLV